MGKEVIRLSLLVDLTISLVSCACYLEEGGRTYWYHPDYIDVRRKGNDRKERREEKRR
jgi:hypothetical protein